jgi:predicted O-methyltransferase YrrM
MEVTSIHQFGEFLKERKLLNRAAEIGVAEGRTSLQFMNWGFKKLYLVDVWRHVDQAGDASQSDHWHDKNLIMCHDKLDKFGDKVEFLKGFSVDMAVKVRDGSLDFVYLDGDHSYEGCKADIHAWLPKLKLGGIMAFHDYNDIYGVRQAVDEFGQENGIEINVLPEEHIENQGAWFVKK